MADDPILERLEKVTVGEISRGPVVLVDHDPRWADRYAGHAAAIEAALGGGVLQLEHVGSTAVPGLPAKPVIDILLIVDDPSDEPPYVPALEAIGFHLRIREPDWHDHRLLSPADRGANLHVFGADAPEPQRMLRFRDRLRTHAGDRVRYARTKRELAARQWPTVQHYADAKTDVVEAILARPDRQ